MVVQSSGPQPLWHQGPVSWKTVFPGSRGGGWGDGFGMIQVRDVYCAPYFSYYYIIILYCILFYYVFGCAES